MLGWAAPAGLCVGASVWGAALVVGHYVFGQEYESDQLFGSLVFSMASGGRLGLPVSALTILLALVATLIKPRANSTLIRKAWITVGAGTLAAVIAIAAVYIFDLQPRFAAHALYGETLGSPGR